MVRGKVAVRGERKRADYLLLYRPNLPLAVVEAKDNRHPVGGGLPQAIGYAEALDVPFVLVERRRLPVPRPHRTVLPGRAAARPGRVPLPGGPVAALPGLEGARRRIRPARPPALLRGPRRQGAPLLPARRRPAGGGGGRAGPAPGAAGHGHRHGEDPHRLPDHLAAVEGGEGPAGAVPRGPQHPRRPDRDQRLQALRPGDDQGSGPPHGPELRGLPGALPSGERKRGREERLPAVQPRLLRLGGHRRMPPGQRPRGQRMAGDPRLLRARHPARPDRHPEGDHRGQHPHLLRRAGLHVLPQAGGRGRIPRALEGRAHRPRQGLAGLAATGGHDRRPRPGDRGPRLQPAGHGPGAGAERAHQEGGREDRRIPLGNRPLGQDHRLLRERRPCGADALGARQRDGEAPAGADRQPYADADRQPPAGTDRRPLEVRRPHHGRQRRGQAGARRLHPSRAALPGHRHHLEAADDRRGRQDLQAHRARPAHRVDDRVQADRGARHPHPRRRGQALVHRHGLQEGHRALRRSGLRRGAGRRLRARR